MSGDMPARGMGGRLSTMEPNEIRGTRRVLAAERDPQRAQEPESLILREDPPERRGLQNSRFTD